MLSESDHVVVVGAGFAGWRFSQSLRREGFRGVISLVGDEPYHPYDRPPLSKQVLRGKWDVEQTTLATPELVGQYEVSLHVATKATSLDVATTTVHLDNGSVLAGTHVVIATGARARNLAFSATGLSTLRGRDDVTRLLQELERIAPDGHVAVIGGGFIGAEVATALHARGLRPVVLEAASRPLVSVLGEDVSTWLAGLAAGSQIELRSEQRIVDVERMEDGFRVVFDSGAPLLAHGVVVAAGAEVNVEWLATSGLTIDNGVVVNADLLATERVGAIGDVARFNWRNTLGEELVRIEHWQTANDHASALAHHWMTGEQSSSLMIPYFWSDQYGKKIQLLGHPRAGDDVQMVSGSVLEGKWVALYSRNGFVNGVVALSHPRALMLSKGLLEVATTLEEAMRNSPWLG